MNKKSIQVGVVALVGALAAISWSQGDAKSKIKARMQPSAAVAMPLALSAQSKAQVAKALLQMPVGGVVDQLDVSVRSPYVAGQGAVDLQAVQSTDVAHNLTRLDRMGIVYLQFKVVKPGKHHLVSLYINSTKAQSFELLSWGTFDLSLDQQVPQGKYVFSCVVTPKSAGSQIVAIQSKTDAFCFSRAEVSVVD